MAIDARKQWYLTRIQQVCSALLKNIDDVNTLSTYWSEQFANGASDAIVDEDLIDAQVVFKMYDVNMLATSMQQIKNLWTGQAVTVTNVGQFIRGIANQF